MTVADYDELIAPRAVDPTRRRRLLAAFVVVGLVASAVGGGVWWHQTASDRAHRAYERALPAAEAAWPGAQAKIEALTPPAGWSVDPTYTACGLILAETVCWQSSVSDAQTAVATTVALLTAQGATVGDHLADTFDKSVGGGRVDCRASEAGSNGCSAFLTWAGASVQVQALAGNADYGVPAAIAIGRGPAYPEAFGVQPEQSSPAVGNDPAVLTELTGLPEKALAAGTCATPSTTGCLRFTVTISNSGRPATVFAAEVIALKAHGFRFIRVGPSQSVKTILTGWAVRYRSAHGKSPAMVMIRVQPDANGHASGTISISNGGLRAS